MDDGSRQQRRKLIREQAKLGQRLLGTGMAAEPKREAVIAVARTVLEKLTERDNGARAGEAAALAHKLAEASLKARPGTAEIACRKGCSYCCHAFVSVLAPEVFRLARALRAKARSGLDIEALRQRAVPLFGLEPGARIGRKLACPVLVDGLCAAYAERPLTCRQATSLDLAACIEEFEGQDPEGRVEVSSAHLAHASNANVVLLGAMIAAGLPAHAQEFAAALDYALAHRDAEARWLAGEDVFAGVPGRIELPAGVRMVGARIGTELKA